MLPKKLAVARVTACSYQIIDTPFFYCGRTTYVNEKLKPCGMLPLFESPPFFRNALVQSIAGGNMLVFNQAAKILMENAGVQNVPTHDWLVYQLISSAYGKVCYDSTPHLLYRLHDAALVG